MNLVEVFISLGLITAIYKYIENKTYDVVYETSNLDNKQYLVRNLPDKKEAVNTLAHIALSLQKIVSYVKTSENTKLFNDYLKDDFDKEYNINKKNKDDKKVLLEKQKLIKKLEKDIKRLVSNFNPDAISENTPDAKYTSYSVNKGEKLFFCIRSKKNNEKLVDKNVMLFVAIHELSHLMTEEVGHPPDFWNNFRFLLKVAVDIKVYKYINFNVYPKDYCGTQITDTPL